jgi:hypothetical protein
LSDNRGLPACEVLFAYLIIYSLSPVVKSTAHFCKSKGN